MVGEYDCWLTLADDSVLIYMKNVHTCSAVDAKALLSSCGSLESLVFKPIFGAMDRVALLLRLEGNRTASVASAKSSSSILDAS